MFSVSIAVVLYLSLLICESRSRFFEVYIDIPMASKSNPINFEHPFALMNNDMVMFLLVRYVEEPSLRSR